MELQEELRERKGFQLRMWERKCSQSPDEWGRGLDDVQIQTRSKREESAAWVQILDVEVVRLDCLASDPDAGEEERVFGFRHRRGQEGVLGFRH